MDWHSTADS